GAGWPGGGRGLPGRLRRLGGGAGGRPGPPATLRAVGGTEGVGVLFLEESLGARSARPEHRLHQGAARAVLKELLPERGTDIKGAVRSREQLLKAAGCERRPEELTALLRILDTDLRLITPTADVSEPSAPGPDPA